ncbi:MAG: hypothetical protein TU35_002775 [Thermoproteus sp. AZ2]|jgi:hypothetical protein|uniref:Uncharacterized protein n=1 Tax=Thermoproteus sp. AZ2 TaxID=1609232 RepID=A0ACC6UZS6_9CREN|nr:MAG: hypothetical protein TU35_03120 [Thermoproteus sp. AZ2]
MALKALVYALSAVAILIGALIIVNDMSIQDVGSSLLIRDLALAVLGIAIGIAAPLLYRKFQS